MMQPNNNNLPKEIAHLSISGELLRQAKDEKINLSQAFEQFLLLTIKEKREQKWLEQSKDAIAEYTQFVEQYGCFGDSFRCF